MKFLVCFCAFLSLCVLSAIKATAGQTGPAGFAQSTSAMSPEEKRLADGSRLAILKTGMSPAFFDSHFKINKVFNLQGDRRVEWDFSINGYESRVSDAIGFYTESGTRIDIHSITGLLNKTADIHRTIPRARAEKIMRSCIGNFTNPAIEYRPQKATGAAALLLTAQSIRPAKQSSRREAEDRREKEKREAGEKNSQNGRTDRDRPTEEEDDDRGRPVILLGEVNLESGTCTVGRASIAP
jgi:hypothetical protein